MKQQPTQKIPERRQLNLCLLAFLVVWLTSTIWVFLRVEVGWQFSLIFALVSIMEAFFLVPVFLAFYWLNQKSFLNRGFLNGACSRIVLGGVLGLLSGCFQYLFDLREGDVVQKVVFSGSQGVGLGILYSFFLMRGVLAKRSAKVKKSKESSTIHRSE